MYGFMGKILIIDLTTKTFLEITDTMVSAMKGAFYLNSPHTGNYSDFIFDELIGYFCKQDLIYFLSKIKD